MPRRLSDVQAAQYRRDGYVCPLPALTPSEVAHYRGRLEAFEAAQGATLGALPGQLRAKSHLLFTWMDELVRHPAVLDAVADLIGPDLLVFHVTAWVKEPGDASHVTWHQDGTYFYLEPAEHLTAWVALSDSTPESGCVLVIPGSQHAGQRPHVMVPSAGNLLSNGQRVEGDVDGAGAVPLGLRAGEISLHHTYLLHSSSPNRGTDRRIGIGISYIPTHVRHIGIRRLTATLVRGEDRYGHFDPEVPPRADFDEAARAFHAQVCARFFGTHGSLRSEGARR